MQRLDIIVLPLLLFASHKDLLEIAGGLTYISCLVDFRYRLELKFTFHSQWQMLIRIVILFGIEGGVHRHLSLGRLRIISKDHVSSLLVFLEEVRYAAKL